MKNLVTKQEGIDREMKALLIHQALCRAGALDNGLLLPMSVAIQVADTGLQAEQVEGFLACGGRRSGLVAHLWCLASGGGAGVVAQGVDHCA
ncbi:hypothetical protein D3C80_1878300 [compost metagenome]